MANPVLDEVLATELPTGTKRLNIVVGKHLYGPVIQKKTVFGKSVEVEKWEIIEELPGGAVDLEQKWLRIYPDAAAGQIKAIEILVPDE